MNYLKNTVLMIEDDLSIYKLFTYVLKKVGLDIILFSKGNESLDWAENNVPSIVLCDILLPDTNGEKILEHLRKLPHFKDVPILAVTALARKGDREKYLNLGFTAYYSKPIHTTTFAAEIKQFIKE